MTEEELWEIEGTWSPSRDGWGLDVATDPESMRRHAEKILRVVAEVRRLEALVEAAFREGIAEYAEEYMGGSERRVTEEWERSKAFKALDGGA